MKNIKVILITLVVLVLSSPALSSAEVKKEFYPSGKLKSEQNYINDKLEGVGKGYYESGKLEWEENYKNGKLEGIARGYFESGKLQAESNFKNGKKHGTLTVYSESGKIQYVETYKNGEMINRKVYDGSDKLEINYGVSLQGIKSPLVHRSPLECMYLKQLSGIKDSYQLSAKEKSKVVANCDQTTIPMVKNDT